MARVRFLSVAVLCFSGLAAAPARADVTASVNGTVLSVTATSDEPDLIGLEGDGSNFTVVGFKLGPGYEPQQGTSPVSAGPGCSADSNGGFGGAKCPAAGVTAVEVHLGAGADHLELFNLGVDVPATADAGGGPDLIGIARTGGLLASPVTGPLTVTGGEGDDIYGFAPDGVHFRSLSGGPGRDSIVVAPLTVPIEPGSQDMMDEGAQVSLDDAPNDGNVSNAHDNIHSDIEDLYGTDGSDHLIGSSADNGIYGGGARDTIDGGAGNDTIRDVGPPSPLPGSMPDSTAIARNGTFSGGPGDDDVDASGRVDGGPGNDLLVGSDVVHGGEGDDRLAARPGGPTALLGDGGNDTLVGSDGQTFMLGGPGHDDERGGAGSDVFIDDAPAESDSMAGGAGADSLYYLKRPRGVTVRLAQAQGNGEPGENDTVTEIEHVSGTDHADHLVGDGGPNVLSGGPGADKIEGGGGDDRIGNERERFDDKCFDKGEVGECFDEYDEPGPAADDKFYGGAGDDRLTDNDLGADVLAGGDGNDTIDATRGGSDRVTGGAGADDIDVDGGGGKKHPMRVDAGTGDDLVRVAVLKRVLLKCGPGTDVAENATLFSDLGRTCEFARHLFTTDVSARPYDLSGRSAGVPVHCVKINTKHPFPCRGVLTLRSALGVHALLGHVRFRVGAGKTTSLRVPLDGQKVREALPRGSGKVRVDSLEGPKARTLRPQQPFAVFARR